MPSEEHWPGEQELFHSPTLFVILLFLFLFPKHLWSAYYVRGVVLGSRDPQGAYFQEAHSNKGLKANTLSKKCCHTDA